MLTQDPQDLRCVQLNASQEWTHKGEQLSFIFPKAGLGKWVAGTVAHKLETGDVLVLNAALGGKICVTGPSELVFWCFSLKLENLFPLFESSEICLLQNISDGFKTAKRYPAAGLVAQECHRRFAQLPAQINLDHRSHLLHVAAAVLTDEFNNVKSHRVGFVRPEEHMVQVFEKLTSVEMLRLSVGELACKFGCSRRHLNRLFHHYFGVSVAALRMEMRLLRSLTLLRDPDAKIIRVAEDCGFNQLGLFNTCFKRRFGSSPGQWRKLNLKDDSQPSHLDSEGVACPLRGNGLCPLSGRVSQASNPASRETQSPQSLGTTRLQGSAKSLHRNGKVEKRTAGGQQSIYNDRQRRLVVRVNA